METVSLWTALPGFLSGDEGKHKQVYGLAQGLGKGALRCENCPHCLGPFLLQTPFLPFQAGLGGIHGFTGWGRPSSPVGLLAFSATP